MGRDLKQTLTAGLLEDRVVWDKQVTVDFKAGSGRALGEARSSFGSQDKRRSMRSPLG